MEKPFVCQRCIYISQIRTAAFSKQFWVAATPFEGSSHSRLPLFTNIFQNFTVPCHFRNFNVVIYLFSFVEDSETLSLAAFTEWKTVTIFFWCFVDTRPNVQLRLRTHFADILNSQLIYTVPPLMIKGGVTLILSFPKAWFLLLIRRSNFRCFLHSPFRSLSFGLRHGVVFASIDCCQAVFLSKFQQGLWGETI